MMTPDERQMLTGLFDRIRAAGSAPRDPEAEGLISSAVQQVPFSPYLLAQTVLVQEQALSAANQRLQQYEAQLRDLQSQAAAPTSFLGGLGKSLFGIGDQQHQSARPIQGGASYPGQNAPQQPYAPQPSAPQAAAQGPWGSAQQPMQAAPGGSFMKNALGTAAGVAGGVMLANSISSLFSGHNNPIGNIAGPAYAGDSGMFSANNALHSQLNDADATQDQLQDQLDNADQSQDADQDADDNSSDNNFDSGSDN